MSGLCQAVRVIDELVGIGTLGADLALVYRGTLVRGDARYLVIFNNKIETAASSAVWTCCWNILHLHKSYLLKVN